MEITGFCCNNIAAARLWQRAWVAVKVGSQGPAPCTHMSIVTELRRRLHQASTNLSAAAAIRVTIHNFHNSDLGTISPLRYRSACMLYS